MTDLDVPPVETPADALVELRRARRRNHRESIHWVDALYRVYIIALGGIIFVLVAAGWFPVEPLSAADTTTFATRGAPWLGLGIAFAVAFGLRSGARGGPLTLEAPAVQHELLAPVSRGLTLRGPAVKQLRFMAFAGAVVGAVVGELVSRRFTTPAALLALSTAATFALTAVLASSAAMIMSGRRRSIWLANGIALLLVAWSAVDAYVGVTTSPLSMLASLAFAPLQVNPLAAVGVVLVLVALALALRGLGGLSLEQARRRAGLVSQLRFAVTLQDVRTVVLLRRQLAQEKPRSRPWIRLRRGRGKLPPTWKRDWQSLLRFPTVRVLRMLLLAVVAGLSVGFTWRGATPAFLVGALALYLAAYDAVEPIAQEVDHPTRWDSFPDDPGRFLTRHLASGLAVTLVLCLVAALTSLALVPAEVVLRIGPILILPVAGAAVVSAAVSTSLGAPDSSKMIALGADMLGFVLVARLIIPPAIIVVCMAPMLAAGSDPTAVNSARVSNLSTWSLIPIGIGVLYLRYRKPSYA